MIPSRIKNRTWKYLAGLFAVSLIFFAALFYWIPPLIERQLNRQDLAAIFQEATGGTFSSGKLRFRLLPAPHVVIPEGRIDIPKQLSGNWRTTLIYPAFSTLLKGRLQIGALVLEDPEFAITVPRATDIGAPASPPTRGAEALKHHLQEALARTSTVLPDATIEIRNGRMRADGLFPTPVNIDGFHLDLQLLPKRLRIDLRCRSNMWETLHLSGSLRPETLQGRLQLALGKFNPTILGKQIPATALQWATNALDINATVNIEGLDHVNGAVQAYIPDLLLQRNLEKVRVTGTRLKTTLTYSSQNGLRVDLKEMHAEQPPLRLSGQAVINPSAPLFKVELMGRNLTIDPLREAAMTLAGDDETVAGIFDVLRSGNVPWIRFSTRGQRAEDMGVFRNMTINGVVENGRLFIPGVDLDLTDVRGTADISHGVLKGDKLFAAYDQTTGSYGRLWLDLDQDDDVPFFLEIGVEADLAPLPALLDQWVDDHTFRGEMRRIRNVSGKAKGTLILDSRGHPLDVTVDVTRCRFDAEYDRLPTKLSITEGMVQYTEDRIQVVQMNGNLNTTVFTGLTAHVAFGDTALIQVDDAAARIAINQIGPWLASYNVFEALPFALRSGAGWLKLDRLKMSGPLLNPGQWAFTTQGTVSRLGIVSPDLPGPAEIQSARFIASAEKIEIPGANILMADADLAFEDTRFLFKDHALVAAAMTINGTLGPVSKEWVSDRVDLGKPWRLKSPVALSDATLTWAADDEKTFLGQLTTGGGTNLSLDLKMAGGQLQHQTLVVNDQDSHAELQATFGPDHLEIDFNGRISSATIERMMQENRYASGSMEGQFKARIYPKHPGSSSVSGVLQAYNIHQPLRMAHTLHIDELSLKAQDNQVLIAPAVMVVDGQTHRVTGTIDIEDDGYVLDLVHNATDFALSLPETPSPDMPTPEPNTFSVWDLPLRGRIISRLDSFTLGKLQWSPFNATVRIDTGNWNFGIEDAALCGVATTGNIQVTPDKMSITLVPVAQDENLDVTMTCLLEKPDLIDGRFDLAGRLGSQGPPNQLSQTVRGQMEFNARKGRIYRFTLLSKALAVVNVTEIFRGKLPDLMEGGLAYESIQIQVDIEDSLLTIKQAVIDGASANIAGQGTVNLLTGETEMIILVAPFKTVDALVSYLPVINDWLGGTLVSIPVRVSGAFSDPTVTPLSPNAVGSSLMSLMKRTIGLPVKLVEPLWKKDE